MIYSNHQKIIEQLHKYETEHNITIVYSALSGSHMYGCSNEDSDYDVYFVYTGDYINTVRENKKVDDTVVEFRSMLLEHFKIHLRDNYFIVREIIRAPTVYIEDSSIIEPLRDYCSANLDNYICKMKFTAHQHNKPCLRNDYSKRRSNVHAAGSIMKAMWMDKYKRHDYPLDYKELVEYFRAEAWYDNFKSLILDVSENIIPRNDVLLAVLDEYTSDVSYDCGD